jgi:hypothetical protein
MAAPTVITITDAHVLLGATQADVTPPSGTGTSYECQVTSAAINANPNLQTVPATFCAPESQAPAATGYELAITWLQDWTAPGGGLSMWAFTNDTAEMWFSLSVDDSDVPLAVGQVRVVAGAFGGDAGTPLTATATWPIIGKPTLTVAPDTVTAAAEAPADEFATA